MKNMNKSEEDIVLSICVITYNHEKYIEQAMDSILQLEFPFPVEILVSDDASGDRTPEILKEKYSEHVKLILRTENVGGVKNTRELYKKSRGRYCILIEGDDYFYNNNTILQMVEDIENNDNVVAIAGIRDVVNRQGELIRKATPHCSAKLLTLKMFLDNYMFDWCALILKREVIQTIDEEVLLKAHRNVGDISLCVLTLLQGDIALTNQVIGAYRSVNVVGESNYNSSVDFWKYYADHILILEVLRTNLDIPYSLDKVYCRYTKKVIAHVCAKKLKKEYFPRILKLTNRKIFYYSYMMYLKEWGVEHLNRIVRKLKGN